ncbi:hypothetical protein ACVBGC_28570 [Burkholderia stagnalis]
MKTISIDTAGVGLKRWYGVYRAEVAGAFERPVRMHENGASGLRHAGAAAARAGAAGVFRACTELA